MLHLLPVSYRPGLEVNHKKYLKKNSKLELSFLIKKKKNCTRKMKLYMQTRHVYIFPSLCQNTSAEA